MENLRIDEWTFLKYRMKLSLCFTLLTMWLLLSAGCPKSFAQKLMRIDETLKTESHLMAIKRKGFRSIGKYEFGSYKIVSGKAGWEKRKTISPLFGDNTTIHSSTNLSFVFLNNEADTVIANIRVIENMETDDGNWFSQTFLNWDHPEIKKGEGVFETVFAFSGDTTPWRLVVIYPLAIERDDGTIEIAANTKFDGMLSDKATNIEIREVTDSADGKNVFNPVMGYEFWQGPVSLAALQVMPPNRMYVWIRDDLDSRLKFVLASGAAALLVKTF